MYSPDTSTAYRKVPAVSVGSRWIDILLANEWATAGLIFILTRLIALLGAYPGVTSLIAAEPQRNKGWLAELALMWDAAWYAGIAQNSYSHDASAPGGTNVAFAPLYPFLMKAISVVLKWITLGWNWGNETYGSLIAAGLLVSNVSFFVALALLIRLLSPRLGRSGAALVALGLASLPISFFFSAIYTEGLFLAMVLGAFAVARSDWDHKWLCAGLLGMLAALDKFAGLLLFPTLAVEYMSQVGWQWRKIRLDSIWLALTPLGTAMYVGYLWWRFGTPLVLSSSMAKGWNHKASFFLTTYWTSLVELWQSLTGAVPREQDPVIYYGNGSRLYKVLDLGMPAILAVGGLLARARLTASEWTWLGLGIIYPLSTNITFSMARYMLPLWPGLIWLGLPNKSLRRFSGLVIILSLFLLAWCSNVYGSAKWIG